MSDWTRLVSERLKGLDLPQNDRDEVIEELAEHLQEHAAELDAAGVTDVTDRALAEVSDWRRLAAGIRRAKEERMHATGVGGSYRTSGRWRVWASIITITVLCGATVGLVTSWLTPLRYRSTALIQVEPPQVSSDYVRFSHLRPIEAHVRDITVTVLSRTRLERVISDFNLYAAERASQPMEQVVQSFRDSISIEPEAATGSLSPANAIRVTYTGADPMTVLKVTERLAAYLKDQSQVAAERYAEGNMAFLQSQSEDVGMRLQAHLGRVAANRTALDRRAQMQTQVLESTYAKLLADLESAQMQVALERRQIGEQFNLVDQARLPQRPIGPTRAQYVGFGALAGLSCGVLVAILLMLIKLWTSNRPQPMTQTA